MGQGARPPVSLLCLILLLAVGDLYGADSKDEKAEQAAIGAVLDPILKEAESLVVEGKVEEANQKILAAFPDDNRTAQQALFLGNVLFRKAPKESYRLHKEAADALPNDPNVQLEWGMEQHRAGEYVGAAKAYQVFTAANPNYVPVFALLAECQIRQDQIAEASESWKNAEKAQDGTLTRFESLLCEIKTTRHPDLERAARLPRALSGGDVGAAEELVLIDSRFEVDWWNSVPRQSYLEHYLPLLQVAPFTDKERARALLTFAEAELASMKGEDGTAILKKDGYLLDSKKTLPASSRILNGMLGLIESKGAMKPAQVRGNWGNAILKLAKASDDPELINVAAHLYIGTENMGAIEKHGWEKTGDERFAVGYLAELMGKKTLTLKNPELAKALTQFPENSILASMVVALTARAKQPMKLALINAIKAEYTRLSPGPYGRIDSRTLRTYFGSLARELAKEPGPVTLIR